MRDAGWRASYRFKPVRDTGILVLHWRQSKPVYQVCLSLVCNIKPDRYGRSELPHDRSGEAIHEFAMGSVLIEQLPSMWYIAA